LAWLLCSMASHPVLSEALAFKGGTALRRVHFGEYLFSEDLDFTYRNRYMNRTGSRRRLMFSKRLSVNSSLVSR
jgi:predicted nucleotidyltransferase component of viral defense system